MKLRIMGNTLRIRLSQKEVDKLGEENQISDSIRFPGISKLVYEIKSTATNAVNCSFMDNSICLSIPQAKIIHWIDTDTVGIGEDILMENSSKLSILVEKDFKCLTKRPNEDESDLFPNPRESH